MVATRVGPPLRLIVGFPRSPDVQVSLRDRSVFLEAHHEGKVVAGHLGPSTLYESLRRTVDSVFREDVRLRREIHGQGPLWTAEEERLRDLERARLQEAFDAYASSFELSRVRIGAELTEGAS